MAQITADGVTGKQLAEYLAAMQAAYRNIDPQWNINPESPDGLQIAAWSETLANLDEQVAFAYQSVDPQSAVGQQLNRIAMLAGINRQDATYSTATVRFSGVNGTFVRAGTRVRNRSTDTLWATNGGVTIAQGVAVVGVTCMEPGSKPASPGDLSIIATPTGGLQSVTNDSGASLGLDEESDEAFRVRRNDSVALPGSNQIDSLYSAISNIGGVKQARILENEESEPDDNGLPGHSMMIIVDGGEDSDILSAIASRKSPGCGLNRYSDLPGKVNGDTLTPKGQPINITFFRPELVTAYVRIEVAGGGMSESDKQTIIDEVVKYSLEGFHGALGGFNRGGFGIGDNVAAGRLYTPVNYVVAGKGYAQSILIGLSSDSVNSQVLDLNLNQLGVLDAENIVVEYV